MKRCVLFCAVAVFGCSESPMRPSPVHVYAVPEAVGDGWVTAHAGELGVETAPLAAMVDRIRDGSYTNIHGILIIRGGRLIFEEYFPGTTTATGTHVAWDRERLHDVHSVTKSVNATLVGIAIDQGIIPGVDERISKFFPEHADLLSVPPKSNLTIEHLLTMTAGLEWDEHTHSYSHGGNSHVQMDRSGDPIGFTLALPVVDEPGRGFRYNSGLSIVLGEIVRRASGIPADAFAERFLFEPLGIREYTWRTYQNGVVQTGGGLALRPRDMARIGQLMLNEGEWDGDRIVSQAWIRNATIWNPTPTVTERYGYQWWGIRIPRHDNVFDLSDQVFESIAAVGRGGQWVFVLPAFDLVAVFTGGNDDDMSNQPLDMMRRFVLPAIR